MQEPARLVRVAARALGRAGLVHAYGHCSMRLDAASFLVSPARPLGLVAPGEACVVVGLTGPLPAGVLGEVRIHREIYRRRPDVGGVVRSMPPHAMSLAAMHRSFRPRHGFGAYFAAGPKLWSDPQLLRSDDQATRLAELLGADRAVLMRGNGLVTAGASLEEAVVLAWYAEDASRVELDCLFAGEADAPGLSDEEGLGRATWSGAICERMWNYLTHADPELQVAPVAWRSEHSRQD